MKMFVCTSVACAALIGLAEGPVVSNVSLAQSAENGLVEITYDLAGSDAVVTLEIQEEVGGLWKTLTGEAFTDDFAGDVAVKVSVGTGKKVFWRPAIAGTVSSRKYRPVLTAYPTDNPPDYMGVDLASGALRFYSNSNTVPYGVKSRFWKLDRMLMRKIPAKGVVWMMGSPDGVSYKGPDGTDGAEYHREAAKEYPHKVRLTYDYYVGVFELTRRQHFVLTGSWASNGHATVDDQVMPAGYLDVGPTRQATNNSNPCKLLWENSGVTSFGILSEAEWEYACRGGQGAAFNCGGKQGNNKDECWTASGPANKTAVYNTKAGPKEGGSKIPNAFGLYDMHGKLAEWVRDTFTKGDDYTATFAEGWEDGAVTENPEVTSVVPYGGYTYSTCRGGKYDQVSVYCRSAVRENRQAWLTANPAYGLRLMCRAEDVIK